MYRVLIFLLLTAGCAGEVAPGRLNVILIVVDTLRADYLGCYRPTAGLSPSIDSLASSGVRFETCISQAPWTLPAVSTILTGLYPSSHGAINLNNALATSVPTLAEKLRAADYATGAVVSHRLVNAKRGIARGFDFFEDKSSRSRDFVSSELLTDAATAWLDDCRDPFFLFLHYFDPHYNYMAHEAHTITSPYNGPLEPDMDIWELREIRQDLTDDDLRFLQELYEGEIRHLDRQIGRLLAYLDEKGLSENTVLIFTADHGEEFMEHGWLGHTRNLYGTVLRVPLIIRKPGLQKGEVREDPAMLVDLYKTTLRLLGLEPGVSDGRDLFEEKRLEVPCFSEVDFNPGEIGRATGKTLEREMNKLARMRSVQVLEWKAIEDQLSGTWELFNLKNDPLEKRNLAALETEELARLKSMLSQWVLAPRHEPGKMDELSADQIDELRSLGYVR